MSNDLNKSGRGEEPPCRGKSAFIPCLTLVVLVRLLMVSTVGLRQHSLSFYYCRCCAYFTPQKANLKTHLRKQHETYDVFNSLFIPLPHISPIHLFYRTNVDVGYRTYGQADFILDEHGTPIAWATNTASWLPKVYSAYVALGDSGEYGGQPQLYPP